MIAKCVTVPAVVAAAVVIAAEFALTDGSASVAGAQFVAPTAVRVSEGAATTPLRRTVHRVHDVVTRPRHREPQVQGGLGLRVRCTCRLRVLP